MLIVRIALLFPEIGYHARMQGQNEPPASASALPSGDVVAFLGEPTQVAMALDSFLTARGLAPLCRAVELRCDVACGTEDDGVTDDSEE